MSWLLLYCVEIQLTFHLQKQHSSYYYLTIKEDEFLLAYFEEPQGFGEVSFNSRGTCLLTVEGLSDLPAKSGQSFGYLLSLQAECDIRDPMGKWGVLWQVPAGT